MGTEAAEIQNEPGGEVAALIRRYLIERGMSKRRLAKLLGVEVSRIQMIARGSTYTGQRYLGVKSTPDGEPFIRRLADELAIPDDELTRAVAIDLGIVRDDNRAASSTGRAPDF